MTGRRVLRVLAAGLLLLAATGCDDGGRPGADPPSSTTTAAPGTPGGDPGFDPPPGQRWTGQGRVVIAVPHGWATIETPFCQAPPTHSVVYLNPQVAGVGCRYRGFQSQARRSYVDIDPIHHVTASDRHGTHEVNVDGLTAFVWNHPHGKFAQSAGILVPEEHVVFYISTPRQDLAQRLIDSLHRVPGTMQTISPDLFTAHDSLKVLDRDGLHATYAERPPPAGSPYGYPGRFMATDPPVGTPVPRGAPVTALFSSGRLSDFVSAASFRHHGWTVSTAHDFTPRVTRDQALRRAGHPQGNRAAFLRTLHIGRWTKLAWIVVDFPRYPYRGQRTEVSAYDARTGHQLAGADDFLGG